MSYAQALQFTLVAEGGYSNRAILKEQIKAKK